jgi:hypothetical protein
MALGAPEDGDNGPTAMVQQPLLHRRLSRRAPFESYKDQEPQHQTRPLPQPGNEYIKAPHQHQQAARFPLARVAYKAVRRRLQQAVDVLLLDFEFANRPLMFRLNQAFKRLAFSLRSDLQMLRDRLLSQQTRDKFSLALELLSLFLLLARTVAASGVRKIIRQLLGQMNRLRATPGQIKQTLQQLGKKQRKD